MATRVTTKRNRTSEKTRRVQGRERIGGSSASVNGHAEKITGSLSVVEQGDEVQHHRNLISRGSSARILALGPKRDEERGFPSTVLDHPCIVTSPGGSIRQANQAAAELLNVPASVLRAKPLVVYVHVDDRERFRRTLQRVGDNGGSDIEIRLSPRGGEQLTARLSAELRPKDSGQVGNAVCWQIRPIGQQHIDQEKLHDRSEQLRKLATEVLLAEERERRRIAIGIHDRVSQPLALAKMNLGRLRGLCPNDGQSVIDSVTELLQQAIDESRSLTFELSPPILYDLGLMAAVEWLGEQFDRSAGLRVEVKPTGAAEADRLSLDARVLLFQAIRELLTNVVKHAQAKTATIWFSIHRNQFSVRVMDDGLGFDIASLQLKRDAGGFGLFSIRTRFEQMGGSLILRSTPGRGSWADLTLPIQIEKPMERRAPVSSLKRKRRKIELSVNTAELAPIE